MSNSHQIHIPDKLIPVFSGDARYRCAYGGRGSGKTRSFATMAAVRGLVEASAGNQGIILCCREYQNSLEESSLSEVKAAIADDSWLTAGYEVGDKYVRTKDGNVSFAFSGLRHNIASIKSKARILVCWIDEAEPVTDEAWSVLIPTVRADGSEIWVTWNPLRKDSATNKRFRDSKDPDTKIVQLNWRDNPRFPVVLEAERQRDLRDRPEQYDHVWEGGFLTVMPGAYYGKCLADARREGRIARVSRDPLMTLRLYWDIGGSGAKADACVIWVCQFVGREIRMLDYYEAQGQPLEAHVAWLRQQGYGPDKAQVWLPHDGAQQDKVFAVSYESALKGIGYRTHIVPNQGKGAAKARIEAMRLRFPMMWFNEATTSAGIEALGWYHEKIDEERGIGLGPDHDWSSHCCLVAGTLIDTARGLVPIEQVTDADMVKTPVGLASVQWSGAIKVAGDLVEIELSSGNKLVCTPDHPVFTTAGVVNADSIRYNDTLLTEGVSPCLSSEIVKSVGYRDAFIESTKGFGIGTGPAVDSMFPRKAGSRPCSTGLFSWLRAAVKPPRLMVIGTISSPITGLSELKALAGRLIVSIRSKSLMGRSIIADQMVIMGESSQGLSLSTAQSGSIIMVPFKTDAISTTSTGISQTIQSLIFSCLPRRNIAGTMQPKANGLGLPGLLLPLKLLETGQGLGTEAKRACGGILSTVRGFLLRCLSMLNTAKYAGKNTEQSNTTGQNTVVRAVSLRHIHQSRTVYDLTVKHHHCYFANGVLVSNCDAAGMLALTYKPPSETLHKPIRYNTSRPRDRAMGY